MIFKKVTFKDIDIFREYFISYNQGFNYNTLSGFFAWREWLNTEYAIQDNSLYMKIVSRNNGDLYCMPLSLDVERSFNTLKNYVKENKINLKIFPVYNIDLPTINKLFEYNIKDVGGGDYIYDFESLKEMSGRKLHGQKNHLNHFKNEYSQAEVIGIDNKNVKDLTEFIMRVKNIEKEKNAKMYAAELKYNEEVIQNFDKYKYNGIMVKYNDEIIGFVLGEVIRETVFLHIMKIDKNCRGVAQFLITEYLKTLDGTIKYVNMEDDADDEDLRYTKLCYHPIKVESPRIIEVTKFKE